MNSYFKQLKKRSLFENAANQILNLIIEGRFEPGQKLPGEREMAESLGINRGTLREALRILEFMRVIEKRVGEGVFVLTDARDFGLETVIFRFMSEDGLDVESLAGAYEAVTRIEGVMVELAAQRILVEELDQIKEINYLMEKAINLGEHFTALDKEFHLSLGRAAKSPVLMAVASTMWVIMERYATLLFCIKENREKCFNDHQKLIHTLKSGDIRQVRRLTEEHFIWAHQVLFEKEDI